MYVREKLMRFLKVKNVIFSVVGVFLFVGAVFDLVSLITYYWGNWDTVLRAKSTPTSIVWLISGIILCCCAVISRNKILDAYFYSSYFEGDLDGKISYDDLSVITGRSVKPIKNQLHLFRKIYMKNYSFKTADDKEYIELESKKCTCECRNCGAVIEKSVYFTGECPYCRSSDLFAKVLTDNRFYSISTQNVGDKKNPQFYMIKRLRLREALYFGGVVLAVLIISIMLCYGLDMIGNYNDPEYLSETLFAAEHGSSYEMIKKDIVSGVIWAVALIIMFLPMAFNLGMRLKYILTVDTCARYFAKTDSPFVRMSDLPMHKDKTHKIKLIKGAICHHYLLNCSFVKRNRVLQIALARKTVKDECPTCGAAIVGAVDEKYKCQYCGNLIMGVIKKK